MFKKLLKLSPAWLVTAITIGVLAWTTFSGGSIEKQSLIIKGNEYDISYQFEPGLKEIINNVITEAKECKFETEGSVCTFKVQADTKFQITLVKRGEKIEPKMDEDETIKEVNDEETSDEQVLDEENLDEDEEKKDA